MQTLILCGGEGTRAHPHTLEVPKPLLEVGGQPVLRHVMEIYASQGHAEFLLAAGFKLDLINRFATELPSSWEVRVVDSGRDANTAERVWACRDLVDDTFFLTYADGLADVDLAVLEHFHRSHPGSASVTVVPLPSPYGTVDIGVEGRVERFREKPSLLDHWVNGGFFLMDRDVFDHWSGADLEREVLPALAAVDQLFAYRHTGFWRSMDTYKDALELSALCPGPGEARPPPWIRSPTPASS